MSRKRSWKQRRWYTVDTLIPFLELLEKRRLAERKEELDYLQALFHIG